MPPSIADEVQRIARGGEPRLSQIRRMIRRLMDRHHISAALFYGDDGRLKPEAADWLSDLAANNYLHAPTFHVDPREDARRQGRRELALEIINSIPLDVKRLDQLNAQAKEIESGGR